MPWFGNNLKKIFNRENSAAWRDFFWIAVFGVITLRLAIPILFAESIPVEKSVSDKTMNAAAHPGSGMVSTPVLRPELFRPPGPAAALYKVNSIENTVNQQLASALVKTAGKAGELAKTVGQSIGDYMKEKQIEKMQEELVQRFYYNLNFYLDPYRLQPAKRRAVAMKVEEIYIEDGQSDTFGLDTISFREMPGVIKKVYGDLLLEETQDGEVKTYYINGRLQTIWRLADGEPHGPAVTYYEDSTEILMIDVYDRGKRISRKKYDELGRLEFEQTYDYDLPESVSPEAPSEVSVSASAEPAEPLNEPLSTASEAVFPVSNVQPEAVTPYFHEAE